MTRTAFILSVICVWQLSAAAAVRKVRAPASVPATVAVKVSLISSSVSAVSIIAGQQQVLKVNLGSATLLQNLVIDIRVVNSSNVNVATQTFKPISIGAGSTLPLQYNFLPSSTLAAGTYQAQVGVWNSAWNTLLYETFGTFSVTTPVSVVTPAPSPAPAPITTISTGEITLKTCTGNYYAAWDPAKTLRAPSLYVVENNDWGVENWATSPMTYFMTPVTEQAAGWRAYTANQGTKYFQCVGIGPINSDNSFSALFKWDYPSVNTTAAGEVKGYPQVVFGQKPGYQATTGSNLPTAVSGLLNSTKTVTSSWVQETTPATYTSGKGHLSYDIWLQTTAASSNSFDGVDKTHEIMITLDAFQAYGRERWLGFFDAYGTFTISGAQYRLYKAKTDFGGTDKWKFIVFQSVDERRPSGAINMREFLQVLRNLNLITGAEYLASIELGVEPELGSGEVLLKSFRAETK